MISDETHFVDLSTNSNGLRYFHSQEGCNFFTFHGPATVLMCFHLPSERSMYSGGLSCSIERCEGYEWTIWPGNLFP